MTIAELMRLPAYARALHALQELSKGRKAKNETWRVNPMGDLVGFTAEEICLHMNGSRPAGIPEYDEELVRLVCRRMVSHEAVASWESHYAGSYLLFAVLPTVPRVRAEDIPRTMLQAEVIDSKGKVRRKTLPYNGTTFFGLSPSAAPPAKKAAAKASVKSAATSSTPSKPAPLKPSADAEADRVELERELEEIEVPSQAEMQAALAEWHNGEADGDSDDELALERQADRFAAAGPKKASAKTSSAPTQRETTSGSNGNNHTTPPKKKAPTKKKPKGKTRTTNGLSPAQNDALELLAAHANGSWVKGDEPWVPAAERTSFKQACNAMAKATKQRSAVIERRGNHEGSKYWWEFRLPPTS